MYDGYDTTDTVCEWQYGGKRQWSGSPRRTKTGQDLGGGDGRVGRVGEEEEEEKTIRSGR
jgi:hypothetical protein